MNEPGAGHRAASRGSTYISAEVMIPGFAETLAGETVTLELKAGPAIRGAAIISVQRDGRYGYLIFQSADGLLRCSNGSQRVPFHEIARVHTSDQRTTDERLGYARVTPPPSQT